MLGKRLYITDAKLYPIEDDAAAALEIREIADDPVARVYLTVVTVNDPDSMQRIALTSEDLQDIAAFCGELTGEAHG